MWPHLQVVYEFFLRFIVSTEVNGKIAKRYARRHGDTFACVRAGVSACGVSTLRGAYLYCVPRVEIYCPSSAYGWVLDRIAHYYTSHITHLISYHTSHVSHHTSHPTHSTHKHTCRYVDQSFIRSWIDLFDAEDPRERDYMKTVLHRMYGKFMSYRSSIRKVRL